MASTTVEVPHQARTSANGRSVASADARNVGAAAHQAFWLLRITFTIAPILFGRLMDRGMFSAVLCGVALFQGLAVVAALRVGPARISSPAAPAVQPQSGA